MSKKILLILFLITAIEFNLQWTGYEHKPNWVKAWNGNQEVEIQDSWEKVGNVYYWSVYRNGELLTFLNFWTSY